MTEIAVLGAASADEISGIEAFTGANEFRFATSTESLATALDGAEVLFGWDFSAGNLREVWDHASSLRWIQWTGAGVDALLFPELVASDIVLSNVRGVFDLAMAETVLGMIIAFEKRLPESLVLQAKHEWKHRVNGRIHGRQVLIVGVGSIGREIARLLGAAGMVISGVGRRARDGDADFGRIHAVDDLDALLPAADYVVLIPPLTDQTRGMFGAAQFAAMKPEARFLNYGRGALVDEPAMIAALQDGTIAGAGLDVVAIEPLPAESPLWDMTNVIISPHMSGDFDGYEDAVADLVFENLKRYQAGEPLLHVVDKAQGFVPAD